MGTDVEILKELFEIAGQDHILAESILESGKIKIDFQTINKYSGSRNANIAKFLKKAVEYMDEDSLKIKELLKYSKDTVLLRRNVCVYLILSYKKSDVTIQLLLYCLEHTSWPESVKLIEEIEKEINVTKDNFSELITLYDKERGDKQTLLLRILNRAQKEQLDYDYLNKNKFSIFYSGRVCRFLLITHFKNSINNEDIVKMFSKDLLEYEDLYISVIYERINLGQVNREFWQDLIDRDKFAHIAEYFIKMYSLSELQKAEKDLFLRRLEEK